MRFRVQAQQTVCDGSGRLLVALILRADLEPLVPRLCRASAHQQQDGQGNLQAHDINCFHFNVNLSAVIEPGYPHIE